MEKWLMTDLHIHTTFSDGTVPLEELVKIYGNAGFDVIAITDHLFDTQSPRSLEIHEEGKSVKDIETYFCKIEEISLWAKEAFGLLIIPGLEICNLPKDYHILGIDLKEPVNPNQNAEGVIEEIHRQGGLAIASHPHLKLSYFMEGDNTSIRRHPLHLWKNRERYTDQIDAWEIGNREDLFPIVGLEHLPFVANSDFHKRPHLTSWKSLILAEKEKESIKQAIRQEKISLFFFTEKGSHENRPKTRRIPEEKERTTFEEMEGREYAKILIADDEKDLVELLTYNLEKKGYRITKAYDGFEAWERIESERPALLILDLMMPEMDGWELCRMIRRNDHEEITGIGILMLTAKAMPEDRIYGLELGADDYLTKPFSISELILRVEKMIQNKTSIRALSEKLNHQTIEIEKKEENVRKVIHDLRTPLVSIGASAKMLLRKEQAPEKSKFLGSIYEASLRLTQWVDEALNASNVSPEELKNQMKEVKIESLVQGVINLLIDSGRKKGIKILFRSPPGGSSFRGNEPLLQRALGNVISNALKYTPRGGKVEVSVIPYMREGDGGVVEISVQDTGIGIGEEDLERIFEPFYRGKNADMETGMGLGLSFVKEVVDLHGGKTIVQSEPRKGTRFSILLPLQANSKAQELERR